MARGGKRAGAGRKPLLHDDGEEPIDRKLRIGAEFDNRWQKLAEQQARDRLCKRFADREIESDLNFVKAVSPRLIRKSDGKSVRQLVCEWAELADDQVPADLPDFVLDAVHGLRDRRKNLLSAERWECVERSRTPQGHRKRLEEEVATWAREHYSVQINAGYVRDCVEAYRAWNKTL